MKIKAFLPSGRFTFKTVNTFKELQELAEKYQRWEYVL